MDQILIRNQCNNYFRGAYRYNIVIDMTNDHRYDNEGSDTLSNYVHFGSNQFSKHKISFQNTNQFSKHEISSQNTKSVLKTRNQFSKHKISSQNTKSVLKTRNQFKIRFSNHKYINMDQ